MGDYVWVGIGLVLLALGAEGLVRGGVGLARRFGVSPLLVGATIVAYGTSTPELVVSVDAALKGSPGIAVGNVVGSNIFNVLLILGVTAVIAPIVVDPRAVRRDTLVAVLAALAFVLVTLAAGEFRQWHGILFLAALVGLTIATYLRERGGAEPSGDLHQREGEQVSPLQGPLALQVVLVLAGLAFLVLGAELLIDGAIGIARRLGISETVIGLSLVAAGTSLPELATSVVAALRRHSDVALGNIIGSNIYNILAIVGVAALIAPVPVPEDIVRLDMWVMVGATLALLPILFLQGRVGRLYGTTLLLGYAAYIYLLTTRMGLAGS